jgi:RimJ/RimL family protein N-acetyltransferase
MKLVAQTERLILREFGDVDARELQALNNDSAVMRYTGDEPFKDYFDALAFVQAYDEYASNGFGRWAVMVRDTGEFAGFCGLSRKQGKDVDLEFRFHRRFWDRGIATEAAVAALKIGFENYRLPEITGRALRENLASISVLQKLGMTFRKIAEEDNLVWLVYAIRDGDFRPPVPPPPMPPPEDPPPEDPPPEDPPPEDPPSTDP